VNEVDAWDVSLGISLDRGVAGVLDEDEDTPFKDFLNVIRAAMIVGCSTLFGAVFAVDKPEEAQCFPWIDKFDDPIHGSIIHGVLDIHRFCIVDRLYLDRPYIKLILRAILKAPEGSFLIG